MARRGAGTIAIVLGGLLFVCALAFLPFVEGSFLYHGERTLWDLTTREPVILTVVAAAAITFGVGSLLTGGSVLLLAATWCSLYLLGQVFYDGQPAYRIFGTGFWVATAAAVVMAAGGVLAVVGDRSTQPTRRD